MKPWNVVLAGAVALAISGPAAADARQDVVDAFTKAMARGEYAAQIVTQVKGRDYVMDLQVEFPNKFHMKNPDMESIILPQGTWMKVNGSWMKMPVNMSQMIAGYSKDAMDQGVQGIGEVREIGDADINGCASKLYQYVASGEFMGAKSKSDVEIAVCGDTGYPVRMTSKAKKEEVVVHYDFTADVSIQPPG